MERISMLNILIDQLVPCLTHLATGKVVKTYVQQVTNKKELKLYNSKNGWYVNWYKLSQNCTIYKLTVENSDEIQGLAAVHNDIEAKTMIFDWAVANPKSNKLLCDQKGVKQEYIGIGGHLFAIAINASIEAGYSGVILGHPANVNLMQHYIQELGAEIFPFGQGYQYTIVIWEEAAEKIRRIYHYENI